MILHILVFILIGYLMIGFRRKQCFAEPYAVLAWPVYMFNPHPVSRFGVYPENVHFPNLSPAMRFRVEVLVTYAAFGLCYLKASAITESLFLKLLLTIPLMLLAMPIMALVSVLVEGGIKIIIKK